VDKAKLFVVALESQASSLQLVKTLQREFPDLKILARAEDRIHAYELLKLGVTQVYRETLGSSLDLSVAALLELGFDASRADRSARLFREHDEAAVREMASLQDSQEAYVSKARQHVRNLEDLLRADAAEAREKTLPPKADATSPES
jgi:voltage-gated potassium channel Kch